MLWLEADPSCLFVLIACIFVYTGTGEGLTVKEGPKWHRMRKLLNPAFHYAILSPYVKIFQRSASMMLVSEYCAQSLSLLFHNP